MYGPLGRPERRANPKSASLSVCPSALMRSYDECIIFLIVVVVVVVVVDVVVMIWSRGGKRMEEQQ